jgi:hypothetical protein
VALLSHISILSGCLVPVIPTSTKIE